MYNVWFGDENSVPHQLLSPDFDSGSRELILKRLNMSNAVKALEDADVGEVEHESAEHKATQLLSRYDNVGIITLDGPLVTSHKWWHVYSSLTSYDAVVAALKTLYDMQDITSALFYMKECPGGDVVGLDAVSEMCADLRKVKPLQSYVSGSALSAGYWIASEGKKIYTSTMGRVGSIGTVITLHSRARMLKEMGIDIKVVRAGKFKAIYQDVEPLSEAVIADATAVANKYYTYFLEHIAKRRSLDMADVEAWGEGKTLFPPEAKLAGLSDGIKTFSSIVAASKETAGSDRLPVTSTLAKASALGADINDPSVETGMKTDKRVVAPLATDEDLTVALLEETPEPPKAEAPAPVATAQAPATTDQTPTPQGLDSIMAQFMLATSKLGEQTASIALLTAEVATLKAQLEEKTGVVTALSEALLGEINRYKTLIGESVVTAGSTSPNQLPSLLDQVKATAKATFNAGRRLTTQGVVDSTGRLETPEAYGITPGKTLKG